MPVVTKFQRHSLFYFFVAGQEAMMEGVSVCRPGACMTEIGSAIHAVADRYGFDTVRK